MDKRKPRDELSILEAVDNLSSMAELDVPHTEAPIEEPSELESGKKWLDPKSRDKNQEVIKETFRVVNKYLHHVYEKDKGQLKDIDTQKGVQAIMVLAGEAAQKVDKFTNLFKGAHVKEGVSGLNEYKDLQQFYLGKIMKKVHEKLETEEAWKAEWGSIEEDVLDIQRRGLKDLETVRRDKEYELFYIRKEDGRHFYNRTLLRHIKMIGDFDETVSDPEGEDPFLRIKLIQDKDLHSSAKEILRLAAPYVDDFYKEAMRYKEIPFVGALNKALMALMLAANPRNQMQNTTGKSSMSYYRDFHAYLRLALLSEEYIRFVSSPPDSPDRFSSTLMNLSHMLCSYFFLRLGNRKDAVGMIHRLILKGQREEPPPSRGPISLWNALAEQDENIRYLLRRYPNGPLLKTLDAFREEEEKQPFDPLMQDNLPSQMYTISYGDVHVSCLHLPSPTRQEVIDKAEIVEEFKGFLRSLNVKTRGQKYFLINLQDRTSWQEHARCSKLEEIQKDAEFASTITVATLAKNTDFYHQGDLYMNLNKADAFVETFKEQIGSAEEVGFYFPGHLKTEGMKKFASEAIDTVHKVFFGKSTQLTRKMRFDFIEIVYMLLTLKWIDALKPDSISFTCKDGIDTGAAASAAFFCFLRLLSDKSPWKKEERDFIQWMLYSFSLSIRERSIDPQRFSRMIGALSHFEEHLQKDRKEVLTALSRLYGRSFFDDIKVQEANPS